MSDPLLSVEDLHVAFATEHGMVRAVNGVSLSVRAGETLALVGESGCGKSTLARAIVGLTPIARGSVRFNGHAMPPLGSRARDALSRDLQMVFQDPAASLNPRMTVGSAVAEPLRLHKLATASNADAKVCALLERVGISPSLRNRYPHELSGGQRQRICIARALAVEPKFIICDEAISALDVSVQAQVLNLLQRLQQETGLTYLFITHDLRVVRRMANRVCVMYLGQIVEENTTEALFTRPTHPYSQLLLSAVPNLNGSKQPELIRGELPSPLSPPAGCAFHPRCPVHITQCRHQAPPLVSLENGGFSRCHLLHGDPEQTAHPATPPTTL